MKRIISFILMLTLAVSLCACGQKEDEPLTWQEQYDLGLHYLEEGNYDEAILAFKAAIDIDPKQAEAYIALAEVYVEQGKPERAARILNKAIDEIGETDELIEAREALPPTEEGGASATGSTEAGSTATGAWHNERVDHGNDGYEIREYNPAGQLVCITWYNIDEEPTGSVLYEYDAAGNMTKEAWLYADGTVNFYTVYEYDADGNQIKKISYNGDGSIEWADEYDTDGNCVTTTHYLDDGSVDYFCVFEYDADGNCRKETYYNADGSIFEMYEYDADGNCVRETYYNPDGTIAKICEYDANGNLVSVIEPAAESVWVELLCQGTLYALERIPNETYFWIAYYDFAPDGSFTYKGGLYASEMDTFLDGTYALDGDDLTMNYSNGKQIRYRVSGDSSELALTQLSGSGILFFHTAGSVQTLSPEFPPFPY